MILKKNLNTGDLVCLRSGDVGIVSENGERVSTLTYTTANYNHEMKDNIGFAAVDVVAVFYIDKHSNKEIAEKYRTLAEGEDNGEWDEELYE